MYAVTALYYSCGLTYRTKGKRYENYLAIWNIDESGVQDVPKTQKVIGIKAECAFQTVSDDKGQTSTVVTHIIAGGIVVPPMVLFKAARVKDQWRVAAPSGYIIKATESGYINAEVFAEYDKQFVAFLKERNLWRADQKHLVLLDLHKSHFNVKYMRWMKEHNIEVCCFPLQPLDDVPYAALKKKYQKELIAYNFKIAGARMTRTQFFCVLVPAFTQAFTQENIRKGFENTGIFLINPGAKKVQETGPSAVTDKCKSRVAIGCLMFLTLLLFQIFVGSLNSFLVSVLGWSRQAGHSKLIQQVGHVI